MDLQQFEDITAKLPRRGAWALRPFAAINDITIHHTAAGVQSPSSIAAWHVVGKGEPGIAYHYLIYPDGKIKQVNDDTAWTWHNGFSNRTAIGVALIGNFEKYWPTDQALAALDTLVRELRRLHPTIKYLTGHREYKGRTVCPGRLFPLQQVRAKLQMRPNPRAKLPEQP